MSTEPEPTDEAITSAHLDWLARRSRGESQKVEEYRDRLGDGYAEFRRVVEAELALSSAIEESSWHRLPRAFGHYLLESVLGEGALGVVYRATEFVSRRRVALKIVKPELIDAAEGPERLRREAAILGGLSHPHVVSLFASGETDGHLWFAMELIEGRTLRDALSEGRLPPIRELCRRLAGIADALDCVHRLGAVHRDVKPANILVRADGSLVLGDFGAARTVDAKSLTMTGRAIGTLEYMSPEQLAGSGASVDPRTDVYGLGATLYTLVTRRPVFEATSIGDFVECVRRRRPTRPSTIERSVSADVERVILRALEKDPRDRHPTAAALRDDLLRIAEGLPVDSRPLHLISRVARRTLNAWKGLAIGALALTSGAYLWSNRDATLQVTTCPIGATIELDGAAAGVAPLSGFRVAPGHRTLRARLPGHLVRERSIEISPGGEYQIEFPPLWPLDPADMKARSRIAGCVGLDLGPIPVGTTPRDESPFVVNWGFPRARVRKSDLRVLQYRTGDSYPAEGIDVQFRRDGVSLGSFRLRPASVEGRMEIPSEVQASFAEGDTIEWGYFPINADPSPDAPAIRQISTARFVVVGEGAGTSAGSQPAGLEDAPDGLRSEMEIRLLLRQGLPTAAMLRAQDWLERAPDSLPANALLRMAYVEAGAYQTAQATALLARLRSNRFSDAARAAWIRESPLTEPVKK